MSITAEAVPDPLREGPNPVLGGQRTRFQHAMIYVFVGGPMVALVAAVPLAWGWGVGWHDLALLAGFYTLAVLGITVGFHRHFTHKAFKARPTRTRWRPMPGWRPVRRGVRAAPLILVQMVQVRILAAEQRERGG